MTDGVETSRELYEEAMARVEQAHERLRAAFTELKDAQAEYDRAEDILRNHEDMPGIPLWTRR